MKTQERISHSKSYIPERLELQSFKSGFVIPSSFPCIVTESQILKVQDLYDLLDFGDNQEIVVTKTRFLNAYLEGFLLTVVLLHLEKGELITRSHRMHNDVLPCRWILTDILNPAPESNKKEINDYCEKD